MQNKPRNAFITISLFAVVSLAQAQSWNGGTVTNPITAPSVNTGASGNLLLNPASNNPVYSSLSFNRQSGDGLRLGLVAGGAGDNNLYLDVPSGGSFIFRGADVTRMLLTNTGYLGIGTTSPSAPLEVNGNVKLTQGSGASIIFPDGTTQTTAFNNSGSAIIKASQIVFPDNSSLTSASSLGSGGGISGQGTTNTIPVFTGSSVLGNSNISLLNGNVGIGTTIPAQKLSISFGSLGFDNFGFSSSFRSPNNSYTNLFLGGALADGGSGTYTVQTDGGSNYFAAIRMDNSGGNAGAINFYTGASTGGTSYTLNNSALGGYERMTIVGGNVGIGTTAPSSTLEVNGNITLTQGSGASIKFPDGTVQSTAFTGICSASGGDYAESVDVTGTKADFEPGDIIVIDPDNPGHFLKSSTPYSPLVAGIYSTKPGYVGRRQTTDPRFTKSEIPMAMVGIVPTKVTTENGPIKVGDPLVTSSTPGYAMHGTDRDQMTGAVVGKALGKLPSGSGVIEALVSLQ